MTGALLMIGGMASLTQLSPSSGYFSSLLAPMIVIGFAGGLTFAPLAPVIMPTVPHKDAGAAGGLLQTMQQTGTSLGLAVLVTIFGAAVRHAGHGAPTASALGQQALVSGMTRAFMISAFIAVAVFAVASTFPKARASESESS
jgi:MFS family permease